MEPCTACQISTESMEKRISGLPGESYMAWRLPSISDHAVVDILLGNPQPLSGYSPATLLAWRHSHGYRWTRHDDTVLIACNLIPAYRPPGVEQGLHFLQPVGAMNASTRKYLFDLLSSQDHPARIFGVSASFLARNPEFGTRFDVMDEPTGANYIYSLQELVELPGRKFQKKRNLLAQASRSYTWTVEPLSPWNTAEASLLTQSLLDETATDETLAHEARALEESLRHLECFGLEGILVRVDGKAVAFSVFEQQTADQAVCHFEKALREYKGLYQVINNETAKVLAARGLHFVNREEDMGDEGLRQAKLSYNPIRQEPMFTLRFRG